MDTSFYNAAVGAGAQQERLNVVANDLANVNTTGYKSRNTTFADLVYTSMAADGADNLQKGHSLRVDKVDIDFKEPGAMTQTGKDFDFAIQGQGFFGVLDPSTGDVYYTRNGSFQITNEDETFYLTDAMGRHVLDLDQEEIEMKSSDEEEEEPRDLVREIGIFQVPLRQGMNAVGDSVFQLTEANGEVYSQADADSEEPVSSLRQGMVEMSNVNMASEMAQIIEAQRVYQLSIRMLQTSDEMEQQLGELRR